MAAPSKVRQSTGWESPPRCLESRRGLSLCQVYSEVAFHACAKNGASPSEMASPSCLGSPACGGSLLLDGWGDRQRAGVITSSRVLVSLNTSLHDVVQFRDLWQVG